MKSKEERAKDFATFHHSSIGQVRKYTGEAYINHPASVAELVRSVPHTEDMLCAAWMHDTLEDTNATYEDILNEFGIDIAMLVNMLTDISKPEDGNRSHRKMLDRLHIAMASPSAKTIKLADLIDNSKTIIERDDNFARVYMREKELLLEVLTEGDRTLYGIAKGILDKYRRTA